MNKDSISNFKTFFLLDGNSALMFKLQMEHDLELSYQGLQKGR